MPETRIYPSSNDYYSKQTQGGGDVIANRAGWCAAASALWCLGRITLVEAAKSNPDKLRAGLLQVKYRWDPAGGGQDFINLYKTIGLAAVFSINNQAVGAFLPLLVATTGLYHMSNGGHSMAADTRSAPYYFYDIEQGLFSYDTLPEWQSGISTKYPSVASRWKAFQITGEL